MILSQYAISKKYKDTKHSMSITALQKQNKLFPKPKYFVEVSEGADRVDDSHPSFKKYLNHLEKKKMYIPDKPNKDLIKVVQVVISVISERYDSDEAGIVNGLIMEGLKG